MSLKKKYIPEPAAAGADGPRMLVLVGYWLGGVPEAHYPQRQT
jgi:hypothetical protein